MTDLLLLTIDLFREFRRMIFLSVEEKKENEPPPFDLKSASLSKKKKKEKDI